MATNETSSPAPSVKLITEPKVYMLAASDMLATVDDPVGGFLRDLGATWTGKDGEEEWWDTEAPSGSEELIEIAGRFCYRSFKVGGSGSNPNVSKIREGNRDYIANILKQQHGSVLEHGNVTFGFLDVSRVFTHEVVRHRVGTAFSQESLRYVRVSELGVYWPKQTFNEQTMRTLIKALSKTRGDEADMLARGKLTQIQELFSQACTTALRSYLDAVKVLELDDLPGNFVLKKQMTSALRRMLPMGMTTGLVMTANHRAWRHMITLRTAPGAEEEIRMVFGEVARQLVERFPNIYQDIVEGDDDMYSFRSGRV